MWEISVSLLLTHSATWLPQNLMPPSLMTLTTGLFGGMGGCAMIGQSIINIKSGGRTRLSGIVAALTLLAFILFASQYIEQVPIAALVGVMFMVVIGTFAWSSFRILHKIPRTDVFELILVSALTVIFDLAIAVFAGVIVSALVFSWENAVRIRARKHIKDDGTKVYEIWGPLFFGSVSAFSEKFDIKKDPYELNDIGAIKENKGLTAKLSKSLLAWMKQVNDPLLDGQLRTPYYERAIADLKNV